MDAEIAREISRLPEIDPSAISVPIYYINLKQSETRREFMETQLAHANVPVRRVDAIDGTTRCPRPNASTRHISNVQVRTTYNLSTTKLACTLSHLKALEQISNEIPDQWAIVCEDDALFQLSHKWPPNILTKLTRQGDWLGAGIIQLYWGVRSRVEESKYCRDRDPTTNRLCGYTLKPMLNEPCWGTVAYLVSPKGVRDILGYTGKIGESSVERPIYLDDPAKCPRRAIEYAHLKRQKLQGVADSFLYGLTPTYICGTPLVMFDVAGKPSLITNRGSNSKLSKIQADILGMYRR